MQEKLRELQLTQLAMLKDIDSFCRKHKIAYSLYAGTLLGAVRHKGFIPWDDDLDICMSRKNYHRFIKTWEAEQPEGYVIQNKENTPDFSQSFTKIRKDHTTFLQGGDPTEGYHTGIFIDVFPIDRIPDGKIRRIMFQLICMVYQVYTREFIPPKGNFAEKTISRILLSVVPKSKRSGIRKKLERWIIRHNRNLDYNTIAIEIVSTIRRPLPSNLLDKYVYLQFEDSKFMCFAEWEAYLKLKFGNYMELPPESERGWRHHPKCLDFERNYDEIDNYNY